MDKQIHIHLHLGDTVLNLADLFGEVRTALGSTTGASAQAVPAPAGDASSVPPPAADTRTFHVAVYDS